MDRIEIYKAYKEFSYKLKQTHTYVCGRVVYTEYEIFEGKTVAIVDFALTGEYSEVNSNSKVSKLESDDKYIILDGNKLIIKVDFRDSIGESPVVEFNTAIGYFIDSMVDGYDNIDEVILDLSDSNFSNILCADSMFYSEIHGSDYNMHIRLPIDKKQLHPVSADGAFESKHIVDADRIIQNINFRHTISIKEIFSGSRIKRIDLSEMNVPNIRECSNAFRNCLELAEVRVGRFFESISPDANNMFSGCKKLRDIDIDSILAYASADMVMYGIFRNCPNINWFKQKKKRIHVHGNLDRLYRQDTFQGLLFCTGAKYIDLRGLEFQRDDIEWVCSTRYIIIKLFNRSDLPDILVLSKQKDEPFNSNLVNRTVNIIECKDSEVDTTINKLKMFGGKYIVFVVHE